MAPRTRIELEGRVEPAFDEILGPDALEFVSELHAEFEDRRQELLRARVERRARLAEGETLDFLPETEEIRSGDWTVAPVPAALQQRWVEITGPTDRKMVINALNSGADGFMADFEDANAPSWQNMIEGQINLRDAIMGTITYDGSDGRHYELVDDPATLLVRPRGWHLDERHVRVDGQPVSGGLFDFGMYYFNSGPPLIASGLAPFFYLPKMESHLEARLWNDVFDYAEDRVGMQRGTIKATVLIETLPAAFEMDEILYELRDHSAGLNAGRWDYIFSSIKCFADRREMVLPDRGDVTMTVPFMRAYTELWPPPATGAAPTRWAAWPRSSRRAATRRPTRRRWPGCAPTRSARSSRATTGPGWPTRTWYRWRERCSSRAWAAPPTSCPSSAPTSR